MSDRFRTLLVANRGEIALRIMRTARSLGYRTVAVASEADRRAPHALFADQCVVIGPPPVGQSYLDPDAIIAAARASDAGAIHPGYGFLSENAAFARRVLDEGLVFVGPSPEAIELMGDKARAKRAMLDAGVPCIPGYQGDDQDDARFVQAAEEAGYPVMVKAAAGGGGRGMRRVDRPEALKAALSDARKEAEAAFGSGDLILEKAIDHARHVEIQVFGDAHGTIIHLGERDCSLQRRHQKVIEEAPSPAVDDALRKRMGEAAIRAAAAVDYRGAGTVEFLLAADGRFYFLEMNTRLQVEHPVTEEVTGLDLVALQLRVAQGEPLGLGQEDIVLRGHAIEARLYAEDPCADFRPSSGIIHLWRPSALARSDAGIATGGEVTPFYDPMLAKVIATGPSRDAALRQLSSALEDTALLGPVTNRTFLLGLLSDEAFRAGEATTTTIDSRPGPQPAKPVHEDFALAAAIRHEVAFRAALALTNVPPELWHWQTGTPLPVPFALRSGDSDVQGTLVATREGFEVAIDGDTLTVSGLALQGTQGKADVSGRSVPFSMVCNDRTLYLATPSADRVFTDLLAPGVATDEESEAGTVTAMMHGTITDVLVTEGSAVEKGARLALLEAMKMQHEIKAPMAGRVAEMRIRKGDQVASGDLLVLIREMEDA